MTDKTTENKLGAKDFSLDLVEICPNCKAKAKSVHCPECGTLKIVLQEKNEPSGPDEEKKKGIFKKIFNFGG